MMIAQDCNDKYANAVIKRSAQAKRNRAEWIRLANEAAQAGNMAVAVARHAQADLECAA